MCVCVRACECSQLIANNLPAAVEDLSGRSVPPSLLTKAATVRQFGGIEYLTRLNSELPQLLQRNKQLLDQASDSLHAHWCVYGGPVSCQSPSSSFDSFFQFI